MALREILLKIAGDGDDARAELADVAKDVAAFGPLRTRRTCPQCGLTFHPRTAASRCCSSRCATRLWQVEHRQSCSTCGAATSPTSVRCLDCTLDEADRAREQRFALIQRLWFEGLPASEIATRAGYANSNVLLAAAMRAEEAADGKGARAA